MRNKTITNGFTLVELMVTVAIIGILAGIAYPSYQESILRSRRADAKGALLGLSNAMERHYTETSAYTGAAVSNGNTGLPEIFAQQSPVEGGTAYYTLTIQASTASTFTLRATPTSIQSDDICGNLEITHTGVKTPATGCW